MAKKPQRILEASLALLEVRTELEIRGERDRPPTAQECSVFAEKIEAASETLLQTIYKARDLLNEGAELK